MGKTFSKQKGWGLAAVVLLILLDRLTKKWAAVRLKTGGPIRLWPGVFELSYLENRGMAFGLLQGGRALFLIMTVIVVAVLLYVYLRINPARRYRWLRLAIVLLAAGAVGNFIDRALQGYVVDFLYVSLIDFPIFNVADCYVTVSGIMLILLLLFVYRDADLADALPGRKNAARSAQDPSNGGGSQA